MAFRFPKKVGKTRSDHDAAPVMAGLVEQHYRALYRYAYRLCGNVADAEDLTQQAFPQAQKCLCQLRSTASARGWLFAIARNLHLKQRRTRLPVCWTELDDLGATACTPSHVLPGGVDPEGLQHALDRLPDVFRIPLLLFYFEELSYREIAQQLNVPLGTVMSRLARAKAGLRSLLFSTAVEGREEARSRSRGHAV